jgi:outer membrane lipoprotein-sorting protein
MKRLLLLPALCLLCATARTDAPSAPELVERSRAVYTTLKSYADRGEVLDQFGPKAENSYRHTFRTYFRAPRHFLFEFTQDARAGGNRIVVWCDGGDFQSWSSATQQHATYPRGSNTAALAFQQFASSTGRSITLIPALVFQGSGLFSSYGEFGDAVAAGSEKIGDAQAIKLDGVARSRYEKTQRETNVRRATVWIDPQTQLLRRILEDTPEGLPSSAVMRITTTLQPQANPTLADSVFQFTVPTARK